MLQPATLLPATCGYALIFNRPTNVRSDGRRRKFEPCAFDAFLAGPMVDVFAVVDHEDHSVKFASVRRGSLLIDSDATGLFIVALARNDSCGRVALQLIAGGHASTMSAGVRFFQRRAMLGGIETIEHGAELDEVSAVRRGAIEGTSICIAPHGVPQTVDELLALDVELRRQNLHHARCRTLGEWKAEKARRRAELLESLKCQPAEAVA